MTKKEPLLINLIKSTFHNEAETKKLLTEFILNSSILSMNKQCADFEVNFAKKQNRKFGVMVNSGSSANLVLIQSLLNTSNLKVGDLVAVSALTWSTNIMPLIQLGLKVVLVDCELDTLNVSLNQFKKTYDKHSNISMFFITNTLGHADNIDEISLFCLKKNILFIEDNCEALGSKVNGNLLGNFGLASTFSFFVGHHLSTIEGGMICTDNEEIYNSLIMTRAHGWDRNLKKNTSLKLRKKHKVDDFYNKYTFYDLAFNVRPTEISGFLGNVQIQYLEEIISKREQNFLRVNEYIKRNNEFYHLKFDHMNVLSSFAIPLITKSKEIQLKYRKKFTDARIEIRPMIAGNMFNQPFFKKYVKNYEELKNATFIHENSFYCGNNQDLSIEDLDKIIQSIDM